MKCTHFIDVNPAPIGAMEHHCVSRSKIEKVPKTQKVFGTGINFILRCHPNWLAAHSFPRHHAAGAVTGAIPGVSFAPLLSPFPEPSAAALTAYTPLSEDLVTWVLFSVIGLCK